MQIRMREPPPPNPPFPPNRRHRQAVRSGGGFRFLLDEILTVCFPQGTETGTNSLNQIFPFTAMLHGASPDRRRAPVAPSKFNIFFRGYINRVADAERKMPHTHETQVGALAPTPPL